MDKFPHKKFLADNKEILNSYPLPDLLQKRIIGFDELEDDLQHTTDEDREKLETKLEKLSDELLEDLEEHFEEHLENNDQEEEEVQPEPIQEPEQEQPEVEEPVIEPEPQPEIEPEPEIQPEESEASPKEPTDEEILEGLIKSEKHLVQPSELKEKGFKGSLKDKRVIVGKFCLHRGKYDTCYKIIIKSE